MSDFREMIMKAGFVANRPSAGRSLGQNPAFILAGDSNSIINQKKYLEGYAAQQGYENIVHYTDDGYSGGNFERPAWKQLVSDIEAGKVAHVLVKDMSRIGRDYLQTGFYTEVLFRQYDVHFVAVGNNVDSNDQNSNEFAPFLNIMNDNSS